MSEISGPDEQAMKNAKKYLHIHFNFVFKPQLGLPYEEQCACSLCDDLRDVWAQMAANAAKATGGAK